MKEDNENKVLQHEQEKLFEIKIAIIQGADVLHDIGKALEDARNKKKASIKKQGDKKNLKDAKIWIKFKVTHKIMREIPKQSRKFNLLTRRRPCTWKSRS